MVGRPGLNEYVLMKNLITSISVIALIAFAGTTFGEVEIKEAPLTWQQAALTDGEELFLELCASCHGVSGKGDGIALGHEQHGIAAVGSEVDDGGILAEGRTQYELLVHSGQAR